MGHYDSAREAEEDRDRAAEEIRIRSNYHDMLARGSLGEDKLKDAVIYLLGECQSFGTIKRDAEIHRRRLTGREGFEK